MTARSTAFFVLAVAIFGALGSGCAGVGDAQRNLRTAVDGRRDALSTCYGAALQRDRNAAGAVQARLKVGKTGGQVEEVVIDRSDLADPTFQSCFSDALREVQLSEPPAVNLDVEYTFQFTPSG